MDSAQGLVVAMRKFKFEPLEPVNRVRCGSSHALSVADIKVFQMYRSTLTGY